MRAIPPSPSRVGRVSPLSFVLLVAIAALVMHGIRQADVTGERLGKGVGNLGRFLGEAFPPDFARLGPIAASMYETFQMALVGVLAGIVVSVPLALLAARNTTPHVGVRIAVRLVVATVRTIPDLVWALIFVVAVGIGPLAGILALTLDAIGFCARFFAERIEEVPPGPHDALLTTGARRIEAILGAIVPEAFPSFVATSLFALEKSVRSAVVLGLVGAGGIGVELSAAMDLWRYDQALTIILVILVVVIGVEQFSSVLRERVLERTP